LSHPVGLLPRSRPWRRHACFFLPSPVPLPARPPSQGWPGTERPFLRYPVPPFFCLRPNGPAHDAAFVGLFPKSPALSSSAFVSRPGGATHFCVCVFFSFPQFPRLSARVLKRQSAFPCFFPLAGPFSLPLLVFQGRRTPPFSCFFLPESQVPRFCSRRLDNPRFCFFPSVLNACFPLLPCLSLRAPERLQMRLSGSFPIRFPCPAPSRGRSRDPAASVFLSSRLSPAFPIRESGHPAYLFSWSLLTPVSSLLLTSSAVQCRPLICFFPVLFRLGPWGKRQNPAFPPLFSFLVRLPQLGRAPSRLFGVGLFFHPFFRPKPPPPLALSVLKNTVVHGGPPGPPAAHPVPSFAVCPRPPGPVRRFQSRVFSPAAGVFARAVPFGSPKGAEEGNFSFYESLVNACNIHQILVG